MVDPEQLTEVRFRNAFDNFKEFFKKHKVEDVEPAFNELMRDFTEFVKAKPDIFLDEFFKELGIEKK